MTDGIAAGRNWPVTDHAVMRWLERIMRMDAKGARRRLRAAGLAHVRDADVIEVLLLQAGWSVEAVCRAILPDDRLHLLAEEALPVASWLCIINEGPHGRQVVTVVPRHAASPKAGRAKAGRPKAGRQPQRRRRAGGIRVSQVWLDELGCDDERWR